MKSNGNGGGSVNNVTLTGEVSALRQYCERKETKTVFMLCNEHGKFYVECRSDLLPSNVRDGKRVMVQGELFSRLRQGQNLTRIAAGLVHILDQVAIPGTRE